MGYTLFHTAPPASSRASSQRTWWDCSFYGAEIPNAFKGCHGHRRWQLQRAQKSHHSFHSKCSLDKIHPPEPRKDFTHIENTTPLSKKTPRAKRKEGAGGLPVVITVNRSDSKWSDSWQSQQATTLEELRLEDMAVDVVYKGAGQRPSDAVLVDLIVQKTGWGFFVQAQVRSSVQQQCNRCFTKYITTVNGSFQAWLTPTRDSFVHPQGAGEDNDDPTVVYFPASSEVADLTGMVRDTIRLSQCAKAICSEACENLGPRKWEVGASGPAVDRRWLPLLKIKESL